MDHKEDGVSKSVSIFPFFFAAGKIRGEEEPEICIGRRRRGENYYLVKIFKGENERRWERKEDVSECAQFRHRKEPEENECYSRGAGGRSN